MMRGWQWAMVVGMTAAVLTLTAKADYAAQGFLSGQYVRIVEKRADLKGPGNFPFQGAGTLGWYIDGQTPDPSKGNLTDQSGQGQPNGPVWHFEPFGSVSATTSFFSSGLPAGKWQLAVKGMTSLRDLDPKSHGIDVSVSLYCGGKPISYARQSYFDMSALGKWQAFAASTIATIDNTQCSGQQLVVWLTINGGKCDVQFNALDVSMAKLD